MVNAPQMWRNKRATEIGQIQASIQITLKAGEAINKEKLIMATMSNLSLSRKTALEYVQVAMYNEGMDIK